jgi:hypothetical protein
LFFRRLIVSDEIIGMDDMMAVYQVTDEFGIDRESISVPLEKGPAVAASKLPDGSVEIVVPTGETPDEWSSVLRDSLLGLGFEPVEDDSWDA